MGKGDNNHNNQFYIIWVTKTGRMIIRYSKQIKATLVTAEKYLWDQLGKHTKWDPVEEFLKHWEQQHNKTSAYEEQLNNSSNKTLH